MIGELYRIYDDVNKEKLKPSVVNEPSKNFC